MQMTKDGQYKLYTGKKIKSYCIDSHAKKKMNSKEDQAMAEFPVWQANAT